MCKRAQIAFSLALLGALLTAFGVALAAHFLPGLDFIFLERVGDQLLGVTATVIAVSVAGLSLSNNSGTQTCVVAGERYNVLAHHHSAG